MTFNNKRKATFSKVCNTLLKFVHFYLSYNLYTGAPEIRAQRCITDSWHENKAI